MRIKDYNDLSDFRDDLEEFGDALAAKVHTLWAALHTEKVALSRDAYRAFVAVVKMALPNSADYIDTEASIRASDDLYLLPDPEAH